MCFSIDPWDLYFRDLNGFSKLIKCFLMCLCTHLMFLCFSYEDGQVGDANINTQEGGIHKEILRVIGNQTATG